MIKVGSKVKEVNWMGQFARGEVLTVKGIDGERVLLADDGFLELWDHVSNVVEVENGK